MQFCRSIGPSKSLLRDLSFIPSPSLSTVVSIFVTSTFYHCYFRAGFLCLLMLNLVVTIVSSSYYHVLQPLKFTKKLSITIGRAQVPPPP